MTHITASHTPPRAGCVFAFLKIRSTIFAELTGRLSKELEFCPFSVSNSVSLKQSSLWENEIDATTTQLGIHNSFLSNYADLP